MTQNQQAIRSAVISFAIGTILFYLMMRFIFNNGRAALLAPVWALVPAAGAWLLRVRGRPS